MDDRVTTSAPQDGLAHGGNLAAATAAFGTPAGGWLDLSTGINPNPYSDASVSAASMARLPDAAALDGLIAAARTAYGATADAALCAAPGTQALIQLLPSLRPGARVAVIGPTYAEHAHVWREAGCAVADVPDIGAMGDADVVVVTNPNNPDGRIVPPAALMALRERLAAAGGLLMVDEAFADVTPEASIARSAGAPGLLVLRSFGKFFGLAGVRLGFALGDAATIGALAARLGPWAVSGPAIEIGARALADEAWIAATRASLAAGRARLDGVLTGAGLRVLGGTDLYRLAAHDDAGAIYRALGHAGILVRPFAAQPTWLRFGLPGDDAAFDRLARALAGISRPSR